jgi:protein-S-isoprenylcysteine O-methyltransferase Ste14
MEARVEFMDAMRICGDLWSALGIIWVIGLLWRKQTQQRSDARARVVYGLFTIAGFYLMFGSGVPEGWMRMRLYAPTEWVDEVGVGLTVLGLAFAVWARIYLGKNWSGSVQVKVGHELMRGGPYGWVRHPIYTGLLVALVGTGFVRGQVRGVLAFFVLLAGFWVKLGIEEQMMRKTFGEEYEEYARKTGALVPRMW